MELYYFTSKKYGLRSLKERRLKIARINELNDPFELLGCDLSDANQRQAFNLTKDDLSKKFGLLCFSKDWRNPVQWAHYSKNHKGICMGFDIPEKYLIEVDYLTKRLACPNDSNEYDLEFMKKVLSTKFSHWKYEKEYRVYIKLDPIEEEKELYFADFSDDINLKKVLLGCESKLIIKDIKQTLGDLDNEVEVVKVKPAFKTFNMVI